ncbi:hypothetical protein [Bradyrhizobium sp. McL0615]|uniref:hypothetical protein n=1 Tax=Bradyrhizobium sp. McL0615 TaxID=3415673 RepID=UPI003CFBA2F3
MCRRQAGCAPRRGWASRLEMAQRLAVGATFAGEFSNVTRSHAGKGIVGYVW